MSRSERDQSRTKLNIINEIKRTTQANGGKPLENIRFESETEIRRYDLVWNLLDSMERRSQGSGLPMELRSRHDGQTATFETVPL
jgi:hypothetical protein